MSVGVLARLLWFEWPRGTSIGKAMSTVVSPLQYYLILWPFGIGSDRISSFGLSSRGRYASRALVGWQFGPNIAVSPIACGYHFRVGLLTDSCTKPPRC